MLNKTWLVGLLAVMAVNSVQAECSQHSCTDEYVERLYVNSDSGIAYVGTTGDETKLDCTAVASVYTTLDLSEPGAEAIYSLLLAAQTANKKVQVRISNGSANCKIRYVTLDRQ